MTGLFLQPNTTPSDPDLFHPRVSLLAPDCTGAQCGWHCTDRGCDQTTYVPCGDLDQAGTSAGCFSIVRTVRSAASSAATGVTASRLSRQVQGPWQGGQVAVCTSRWGRQSS
eukprot:4088712-Amphidinium_carterae.1